MSAVVQIMSAFSSSVPSILVSGAGNAGVNGTYTYTGLSGGINYYNKSGTSNVVSSISFYALIPQQWRIYDSGGTIRYTSSSTTTTPDLATGWTSSLGGGDNPAPTVTAV